MGNLNPPFFERERVVEHYMMIARFACSMRKWNGKPAVTVSTKMLGDSVDSLDMHTGERLMRTDEGRPLEHL